MLTIVESVRKVVEAATDGREVTPTPAEATDWETEWERAKHFAVVVADFLIVHVAAHNGPVPVEVTLNHDEWRAFQAFHFIHDGGDEAAEVGGLQEIVQALAEAMCRIVKQDPLMDAKANLVKRLTWLLEGWAAGMRC